MKVYPSEILIYQKLRQLQSSQHLQLSSTQMMLFNRHAVRVRTWAQHHPRFHAFMQALPFLILGMSWLVLLGGAVMAVERQWCSSLAASIVLGLLHGLWGYQWVIYGMHEGAGHGLFQHPLARALAYHSARLLFADPEHYRQVHQTHHRYLGTEADGAFTHFVLPTRVLRSMLPGAGILYSNDYQIHQNPRYTLSRGLSDGVGAVFLFAEIAILSRAIPWYMGLIALGLLSPWIGMMLDRMRESLEHHMMAPERQLGAKEMGLGPMALLIGGGPWGQPCHLTHHMAQDLNWYQQLWLHLAWKKILTPAQSALMAPYRGSWLRQFIHQQRITRRIIQQLEMPIMIFPGERP